MDRFQDGNARNQFRDENRRDIAEAQSIRTDSKMATPGSLAVLAEVPAVVAVQHDQRLGRRWARPLRLNIS
eukprot:SAG25_NODE_21_length_22373_cov_13.904373_14_plen_71_part_00